MTESRSPEPWPRELSREVAKYEMFRVRHDRLRSPRNGSVHDFHIVDAPDGVTVLAFTPERELVLVEQFRHGVRRATLESPSGILEEEEDPVRAGLRELEEETGYRAERAERLGVLTLNPSWQTTRVHVVLAHGATREAPKDLDEAEDTRVHTMPLARARRLARDGEIDSAVVVAALGLLALHEQAPL